MQEKKELRKRLLTQRNAISPLQKQTWDRSINEQLELLIAMGALKTVHTYIPMEGEVNLVPFIQYMLARGVKVVCPKTLPGRVMENRVLHSLHVLEEGKYGTQHPAKADIYTGDYDLIIVPGLAFDVNRYRMGYGGGYYDNFLKEYAQALKVGVSYPFQCLEVVPTEAHDVQLDLVLTP